MGFFVCYVLFAVIVATAVVSKKFRKVFSIVLIASLLFACVLTLHGAARAESIVTFKQGNINVIYK